MSWNPREDGALCDECVLHGCTPVRSEFHEGAQITVVAEAPGRDEEVEGAPLVGASGQELMRALNGAGLTRKDVNLANVISCRPDNNDMKRLLRAVEKKRKAQAKAKLPESQYQKSPIECCRPRLEKDLQTPYAIPMGKYASHALLGPESGSIMAIRGTLNDLGGSLKGLLGIGPTKIVPTVHPAFVLRQLRWRNTFFQDIKRAVRWFTGKMQWQEPEELYSPSPAQLEEWLYGTDEPYYAYDVETDGIEPLLCKLRCVGIATRDRFVIVPLLGIDGHTRFYSRADEYDIIKLLNRFFTDPKKQKIGHNSGYYDRMVMETQLGITVTPHFDTILLHKSVDPEMPHSLAYVGSLFTDVHAWKSEHTAVTARDDMELWRYCGLDCVITARIAPPLYNGVKVRRQQNALAVDHRMQELCTYLHRVGMPVDQAARERHAETLVVEIQHWAAECRRLLAELGIDQAHFVNVGQERFDWEDDDAIDGDLSLSELGVTSDGFNPGSYPQVRKVLFGAWQLPEDGLDLGKKELRTLSGARSTSDAVLREYLCDARVTPEQKQFIMAVRMYRKKVKLFGTYVRPLRNAPGEEKPPCRIHVDSRIHANWNAHVTVVGRMSSSKPNVQNFPSVAKDMIAPAPGWLLVGADMDQLHLRIIAALWKVKSLQLVFEQDLDPHGVFAETVFEDLFVNAEGYKGFGIKPEAKNKKGLITQATRFRDIAKRLRYAGAYGAKPETIYRVLLAAEDEKGNLVNPDLTLTQVEEMHGAWMDAEPEWMIAWDKSLNRWKNHGYLVSPIYKRRRDFLDEKDTDVINYEILACEGDIMCAITIDFLEALENEFGSALAWKTTEMEHMLGLNRTPLSQQLGALPPRSYQLTDAPRLINQCHDSLTVECQEKHAKRVAALLEEVMDREIPGFSVRFTAEAAIGPHWGKT